MNTDAVDKVSEIIGVLCEKLGTTAQYLIPELAKMNIAEGIVWFVLSFVGTAIGIYFIPKAWAYDHSEDKESFDDSYWTFVPLFVTFIFGIMFIVSTVNLVGWIASPTAKTVMTILNSLKD